MLQHGSEEQRVDSLVSEMVERFLGKYDASKKATEQNESKVEVKKSLKNPISLISLLYSLAALSFNC